MKKKSIFISLLLLISLFISCSNDPNTDDSFTPISMNKSDFIAQIGVYKVETKLSGDVSDGETTYATLSGSELDYIEVKGLDASSNIDVTIDKVELTYNFKNTQLYNYMKNYMGSYYYENGISFTVQYDDTNMKIECSSTSKKNNYLTLL